MNGSSRIAASVAAEYLCPRGPARPVGPSRTFLMDAGGPNNVTRLGIAGRVLPMTVVICALGSGCGSPNAPTPAPSIARLHPAGTVAVGTGGRVIDVDSGHPIAGANVTAVDVCNSEFAASCRQQPARVTADENGVFLLTLFLPPTWNALTLNAARAGYETTTKGYHRLRAHGCACWKSTQRSRSDPESRSRRAYLLGSRRVAGCRRIAAVSSSRRLQVNQSTSR